MDRGYIAPPSSTPLSLSLSLLGEAVSSLEQTTKLSTLNGILMSALVRRTREEREVEFLTPLSATFESNSPTPPLSRSRFTYIHTYVCVCVEFSECELLIFWRRERKRFFPYEWLLAVSMQELFDLPDQLYMVQLNNKGRLLCI